MFAVIFFVIALIGAVVQLFVQKQPRTALRVVEVLLLWQLVVANGVAGLFGASGHLFNPDSVARSIGWPTGNLFQEEVGFANLAFGVLGILCIWWRDKFWDATVIGVAIFLLGAAYTHIYDLIEHNNHNPGNAGAVLYMDIILPAVAIALLVAYRLLQRRGAKLAPPAGPL